MRRIANIEAKKRTTTRKKRQYIDASNGSLHGRKELVFSHAEETIVSVLASITPLPATDLYKVLCDQLPHLTWQNLQACLANQKRTAGRIGQEEAETEKGGLPTSYMIADVIELCFNEHKYYLITAVDQKSLLLFADVLPALTEKQMARFFNNVVKDYPYSLSHVENANGQQIVTSEQLCQLEHGEESLSIDQEWAKAFPSRNQLHCKEQRNEENDLIVSNDLTLLTNKISYFVWQYNVGKSLSILDDNTPYGDVVKRLNEHDCYREAMEYFICLYLRFPDYELKDQQISGFIRNQLRS